MNKKNKNIIIGYALLLLVGGFMGYAKSHSLSSIIMATSFSSILFSLVLISKKLKNVVAYTTVTLLLLDSFFTYRFLKTFKIMPAGGFAILTFIVIIAFIKVSDPIQNKAQRAP
jgi:uncharacterized membrane protein (UPF0136 family)